MLHGHDPANSDCITVTLQHDQIIWGLGSAQECVLAQTPSLQTDVRIAALGTRPFGDSPAAESDRENSPGAYALQRIQLTTSTVQGEWLVLIRQLLSVERDVKRDKKRYFQDHFAIIPVDQFRAVNYNFGYLIDQWDVHKAIPGYSALTERNLPDSQSITMRPVKDRLENSRLRFQADRDRIKKLLFALLSGKPCSIVGFSSSEEERLALLEFLVLLLPLPLRPQVTFATRVFGPPHESLRIAFESHAPRHVCFDWQQSQFDPEVNFLGAAFRYADEIVELVFGQGLYEQLKDTPEAQEIVRKLNSAGGPALVTDILDKIGEGRGAIKLGSTADMGDLYANWQQHTEGLDSWRVNTGRDDFSTRARHLESGGSLSRESWIKTLTEAFRRLASAQDDHNRQGMRALILKQLHGPDKKSRTEFFDHLDTALAGEADFERKLSAMTMLVSDNSLSHELRDSFFRIAARAATTADQVRKLLKMLLKTNNWDESALQVVLTSPGIAASADLLQMRAVLQALVGATQAESIATGRYLKAAYEWMDRDDDFLYSSLNMALKGKQLHLVDGESLALIEERHTDESRWSELLQSLWPLLLDPQTVPDRRKDVATWTEAARLDRARPANGNVWARATAVCLAWQNPLGLEITAIVQKYAQAKSSTAERFFDAVFDAVTGSLGPESAKASEHLLPNLITLLQPDEVKKQREIVERLLAMATKVAADTTQKRAEPDSLLSLMKICAATEIQPKKINPGWIPVAFKVRDSDEAVMAAFKRWVTALSKFQDEQTPLIGSLQSGEILPPAEQVKIYDLLIREWQPATHGVATARRCLAGALAQCADELILEASRQMDADSVEKMEYEAIRRELMKINEKNDIVSLALSQADVARFYEDLTMCGSTSSTTPAVALYGLLWMEKWLSKSPDLATECRTLMTTWASALPSNQLRSCLELLWPETKSDASKLALMDALLAQYGENIARSQDRPKAGTAISWAIGYLDGIGPKTLDNLFKPISRFLSPDTEDLFKYLLAGNTSDAVSGDNFIKSYERDFRRGFRKSEIQPTPDPRVASLNSIYLVGLLNYCVKQGKTRFADGKALDWLADQADDYTNLLRRSPNDGNLGEATQHFAEANKRLLDAKLQSEAWRQSIIEEKRAAARLALTIEDKVAWKKIAADLISTQHWDGRELSAILKPIAEPDRPQYLQILIEALPAGDIIPTARRLRIYLDMATAAKYTGWVRPVMDAAIKLLAHHPDLPCSWEHLEPLLEEAEPNDKDAIIVKQKAYELATKALPNSTGSDRTDSEQQLRSDYIVSLVESQDVGLLVGLRNGLANPVDQVLAYGKIWQELNPPTSDQSNPADGRLQRIAAKARDRVPHIRRETRANPRSEEQARRLRFVQQLIEMWDAAAQSTLTEEADPLSSEDMGLGYRNTFTKVVLPNYSELPNISDAMFELLLQCYWKRYFDLRDSGERETYLQYVTDIVNQYQDALSKAKPNADRCGHRIEATLGRVWPQDRQADALSEQITKDLNQLPIGLPKKRTTRELIQNCVEKEVRKSRRMFVLNLITTYESRYGPQALTALESLTEDDIKEIKLGLGKTNRYASKEEEIRATVKRDHSAAYKIGRIIDA